MSPGSYIVETPLYIIVSFAEIFSPKFYFVVFNRPFGFVDFTLPPVPSGVLTLVTKQQVCIAQVTL